MRSGKKFTLGFLPSLLALLALVVAACGGGTSGPTTTNQPAHAPKSQQIYRIGVVGTDIATFDPGVSTDLYSINAIQMVFTGLIQLNDKLQVTPQLAKSYEASPDGLTWTFHLKPGLKFSDGTSLTANDVAYSIDRALSPDVASLNGVTLTYLGLIKDAADRVNGKVKSLIGDSLKVVDDNTIQIVTSKKTAYFLEALTYPTAFVVEKSVIEKWGAKWTDHLSDNGGQGGDGPFKVKSYSHTTGIQFIPNPNYEGKQPQLQEVDMNFYKSNETSYQAYLANQLDSSVVPAAHDAQAEAKPKEFHKYNTLTISYVGMNFLAKPFDNVHIRQAFELAVNKDVLAKALYNGLRTPTCHIVPQGMPGYNANLQCPGGAPTKGDPTKAKALFQQGLQEEGLTLATFPPVKFTYPSGSATTENLITTMRQDWQQVLGVNVTAHVEDFNAMLSDLNANVCTQTDLTKCQGKGLQMWTLAWGADYPDPQDWLTLQFDKGAPNNTWNYGQNLCTCASAQQQIQTQLEQADATVGNDAQRMSIYNQAEQSLVNDVAWMSMFQPTGNYNLKTYVVGVVDNAINEVPPDDWGQVYISTH
ncbi:MAG TPA: peptide ABC transporter substrate-binding protein [Ktedonobacteraceae bacterium]|nr:peptide ABC transporter substrate-binding protein [Ktedonobacteraceae bacterium]